MIILKESILPNPTKGLVESTNDIPKELSRMISSSDRKMNLGDGVTAYQRSSGSLQITVHVDTVNGKASIYTYDMGSDREKESKLYKYDTAAGLKGLRAAYSRMTGFSA